MSLPHPLKMNSVLNSQRWFDKKTCLNEGNTQAGDSIMRFMMVSLNIILRIELFGNLRSSHSSTNQCRIK